MSRVLCADRTALSEGLERMLRMYCVANWFDLSDEACEDALYARVGELLLANGMKLSGGTIVDATLIAAPLR